MVVVTAKAAKLRGIYSCVPARIFDNLNEATQFDAKEVEKVVRMAGVKTRHMAGDSITSVDLCTEAARATLKELAWDPESVDALIFVTQSPDYFLPSSACIVHRNLKLSDRCAAFDVGLGCSGYTYGLWLAAMMLERPGVERVLLLHGETPTRFALDSDRAVALLFGDAGTATALECGQDLSEKWWFILQTDGNGWEDLVIYGGAFRERFPEDPGRHFVHMNGTNVFSFTIKRVPPMIHETLGAAGLDREQVDYFIFHQSNRYIIQHLVNKTGLPEAKVPLIIGEFGSAGGPSVPLTITQGKLVRPANRPLLLLLLAYGVGLSWGSSLIKLPPDAVLGHVEYADRG